MTYEAVRHGPDHAEGPIRPCGPIIVGGPIGAVMLFISIKQLVNRAVPVDFYCNYDFQKIFSQNKIINSFCQLGFRYVFIGPRENFCPCNMRSDFKIRLKRKLINSIFYLFCNGGPDHAELLQIRICPCKSG